MCPRLHAACARNGDDKAFSSPHDYADKRCSGRSTQAACGKDPGFTPEFLLDHAGRHAAYTQADLNRLSLRRPLDLRTLKQRWLKAMDEARRLIAALPPDEIGCLYLDESQRPVTPDTAASSFGALIRHKGCVRGAWPSVTPVNAGIA